MKAFALLLVFVLGKLAIVDSEMLLASPWAPFAYFWQDALVALAFAPAAQIRHARLVPIVYWALVLYTAANVPVARALGTPLTWPMVRAAGGPLADSLLLYATWSNALAVGALLAIAGVVPPLGRQLYKARPALQARRAGPVLWTRLQPNPLSASLAAAIVVVTVVGTVAASRIDTRGADRNVVLALARSGLPDVRARHLDASWSTSPFAEAPGDDFTRFAGAARGRNVIVVSLESTAAQYLPLYGAAHDVAPRLGELSRDALVFDAAYAAYPESIKGLFSLLCATYPAFDVGAEAYGGAPCAALPATLRANGYRTALFHSGRFGYLGMEAVIGNRGFDLLEDAGSISGRVESSFGVDEPSTVARILAWIDGQPRDRPFFVLYMPIAGHHPYETPEPGIFAADDEMGRYRNALRYGDAALGTLIDGLRTRGLFDNTVWVVFGDHGEAFGQHPRNYGHTFELFDENVRVPMVIAAPGLVNGQQRAARAVSIVDIAPTVLHLLDVPVPAAHQGRSMLDPEPRLALFLTDYSRPLAGLRDGRWKFVYDLATERGHLYDVQRDAGERTDVAGRFPGRAAAYAAHLRRWAAAQKALLRRAAPSDPRRCCSAARRGRSSAGRSEPPCR